MGYIAATILGVIAYIVSRQKHLKNQEAETLRQRLEYYNKLSFHIIIESITEDDNEEYIRAETEREWLLKAENPNGVKVIVCAYRDADGCYNETWDEYQGRLSIFKQELEATRHKEIRANNIEGYRRIILGKKMPQATAATSMMLFYTPTEINMIWAAAIVVCIILGWFLSEPKSSKRKRQAKKKTKDPKTVNVNGVLFREVPQINQGGNK